MNHSVILFAEGILDSRGELSAVHTGYYAVNFSFVHFERHFDKLRRVITSCVDPYIKPHFLQG